MSTGLKANSDGSAAIQVGGSDAITLTSGGAATFLTSPTTVQAGTVSAPSITFSGDTNTGIYSPGADQVTLVTGGAAAITISSGQRSTFPTTIGVGAATPSTSGTGITFPATQSASSDANTLDDYEEGTWTPTDASGAGLTFTTTAGLYIKVGRLVVATFRVTYPSTANGSSAQIGSLPFTSNSSASNQQHQGSGIRYTDFGSAITLANNYNSTTFTIHNFSGANQTNANASTKTIDGAIIYQT